MNGPGRYNNFNDEDWRLFGSALFEWAISEYRQMLKATDRPYEAMCKLALNSALESLAKYFVVCQAEKGVKVSFDDAYKEAYDLVQLETNLDLEQQMKL